MIPKNCITVFLTEIMKSPITVFALIYLLSFFGLVQSTDPNIQLINTLRVIVLISLIWLFYISISQQWRRSLTIAIVLILIFSPYLNYAAEYDGYLWFSSGYSADFQQMVAFLHSLIQHGTPVINPYFPDHTAHYHYGLTAPLAFLIQYLDLQYDFLYLSNIVFCWQIFVAFIVIVYFASLYQTSKQAAIAIGIGIFASSWKFIHAGSIYFLYGASSSYDTPIGFKTIPNEIIFSPHYILSGIMMLHIYLSIFSRNSHPNLNFKFLPTLVIAFVLPILNAFSIVIPFFFFVASVILSQYSAFKSGGIYRGGWSLILLVCAYISANYFGQISSGHRLSIELEWSDIPIYMYALVVNFAGLLLAIYFSKKIILDEWLPAIITVSLLSFFIIFTGIETEWLGVDTKFNISRRIGSFIGILAIYHIRIDRLNRFKIFILAIGILSFASQYYLLLHSTYDPARSMAISSELININKPYRLDNRAFDTLGRSAFNMDLIVGSHACTYPISPLYKTYGQNMNELRKVESSLDCFNADTITITGDGVRLWQEPMQPHGATSVVIPPLDQRPQK